MHLAPLLALLAWPAPPQVSPPGTTGRALIIVLDDVGYDDLREASQLGLTPSIDALARRGVSYTQARANAVCSPSRSSLVTGLWYAGDRGVVCTTSIPGDPIPRPIVTIAELAPYPDALVGKYHLGRYPNEPWQRGYASLGFENWLAGSPMNVKDCFGDNYSRWLRVDNGFDRMFQGYEPIAVRDAAVAWWTASRGPALMVVCPQLAHGPFHRPAASLLPPGYPATTTDREKFVAMIAAADSVVGEIVQWADVKRDLVIVVGDNGTPEQVAPEPDRAKTTTFERGIRVPMIAAGPGFLPGTTDARLRHIADVLPTVAAHWRVPCPPVDGIRLQRSVGHVSVVVSGTSDLAAVGSGYKLRREAGGEQLFALGTTERVDLLGRPEHVKIEAELRAALDAFEARP